jgi:hypothetical protein
MTAAVIVVPVLLTKHVPEFAGEHHTQEGDGQAVANELQLLILRAVADLLNVHRRGEGVDWGSHSRELGSSVV